MAFQNFYPQYQQYQQPRYDFIPVQNEIEARSYPVAAGNSVNFKDENSPYIYTKTMGTSPLSQPVFEKFKLIKEEDPVQAPNSPQIGTEIEKRVNDTLKGFKGEIEQIWSEIKALKGEEDE